MFNSNINFQCFYINLCLYIMNKIDNSWCAFLIKIQCSTDRPTDLGKKVDTRWLEKSLYKISRISKISAEWVQMSVSLTDQVNYILDVHWNLHKKNQLLYIKYHTRNSKEWKYFFKCLFKLIKWTQKSRSFAKLIGNYSMWWARLNLIILVLWYEALKQTYNLLFLDAALLNITKLFIFCNK